MQRRIYKSVVLPSVVFPSLVAREPKVDWKGKPADWSDIRKDCPANSIALYAGVKSDYSAYDNLGFTATCVGGYNVYIDGTQYGTTYASGATCSITWSSLALDTGDDITTPSAMKAHKIWVEPATSGNNITAFQCNRVAASGTEEQGILWAHFNLTNVIKIASIFGREVRYNNMILNAITAKNNLITYGINQNGAQSGFYSAFYNCSSLEYLPVLKAENTTYPSGTYLSFRNVPAKKIVIKNNNGLEGLGCLNYAKIEEIKAQNGFTMETGTGNSNMVISSTLKKFPKINDNKGATFILKNCTALEPTNIDDRFNNIRTLFQFCGTTASNRTALTSLRVSSEAPFDNATSPQINVSYTGLDRNALVQLFNDLPNVSAGQIINITGTTGSEDLTASDIAIAENKGWTIAGGSVQLTNVSLVGSLVNNTGVISNFSSSNYAPTSITMNVNQDFKFDVRVNTGAIQYSSITYPILAYGAVIVLSLWNGCIRFGVGNNSSWSWSFGDGTQYFNQNTNYDIHLERTNGIYSCKHKEVGSDTWVDDFTYYNPNLVYADDFSPIFGSYGAGSPEFWPGSIDLKNTSFETNGITYKFVL